MPERERLLQEIEAFIAEHRIPASNFGRDAINDTALVGRLRSGGDVRSATIDRVREYMRNFNKRKKPKPGKKRPRQGMATATA